jgi:hypothetical protein
LVINRDPHQNRFGRILENETRWHQLGNSAINEVNIAMNQKCNGALVIGLIRVVVNQPV